MEKEKPVFPFKSKSSNICCGKKCFSIKTTVSLAPSFKVKRINRVTTYDQNKCYFSY